MGLPWCRVIAGIGRISDDRMSQRKHVHSQLMAPAACRLKQDLGRESALKGSTSEESDLGTSRAAIPGVPSNPHSESIRNIICNGPFQNQARRCQYLWEPGIYRIYRRVPQGNPFQMAIHEGEVKLFDPPLSKCLASFARCLFVPRPNHGAGRSVVKAVTRARACDVSRRSMINQELFDGVGKIAVYSLIVMLPRSKVK